MEGTNDDIIDAIVWNKKTKDWYFVEERLLDLLPPAFSYPQDENFQNTSVTELGLQLDEGSSKEFNETAKSVLEQQFFDSTLTVKSNLTVNMKILRFGKLLIT